VTLLSVRVQFGSSGPQGLIIGAGIVVSGSLIYQYNTSYGVCWQHTIAHDAN